ncbi:hypothetical protein GCM10010403_06920 [Glycomyces rutgersensis]
MVATLPQTIVARPFSNVNTGGPESDTQRARITREPRGMCASPYHLEELPSPPHSQMLYATRKVITLTPPAEHPSTPSSSPRDREVIAHLIAAPDQQTAAEWLGITDRHLRRRVDSIMRRFGAETTLQMVVMATLYGDVNPKAVPANTPAHELLTEAFNRRNRASGTP